MEEAEDQEVEAILGETLMREETLREGEIPKTPEEGEIQEEIQGEKIKEAIASLARNLRSSMEIEPKWKGS